MGQKFEKMIPAIVVIVCATMFSVSRAGAQGAPVSYRSNLRPSTSW